MDQFKVKFYSKELNIEDFLADPEIKEHFKDYFVQQVYLFSDLAMSRNKKWKRKLEKKYPCKAILRNIFNPKLPENMRSSLCQLAVQLYLNQEPYYEIQMPELCRVWTKQFSSRVVKEDHFQLLSERNIQKSNSLIDEGDHSTLESRHYNDGITTMIATLINKLEDYLINVKDKIVNQMTDELFDYVEKDRENYLNSILL